MAEHLVSASVAAAPPPATVARTAYNDATVALTVYNDLSKRASDLEAELVTAWKGHEVVIVAVVAFWTGMFVCWVL